MTCSLSKRFLIVELGYPPAYNFKIVFYLLGLQILISDERLMHLVKIGKRWFLYSAPAAQLKNHYYDSI